MEQTPSAEDPRAEYVRANHERLSFITQTAEQLMAGKGRCSAAASIVPDRTPPILPDLSDVLLHHSDVSSPTEVEAARLASHHAEYAVSKANTTKDIFLSWATDYLRPGQKNTLLQLLAGDTPPQMVDYSGGVWRETQWRQYDDAQRVSQILSVEYVALQGVEGDKTGACFIAHLQDEQIIKTLDIMLLENEPLGIAYNVSAAGDTGDAVDRLLQVGGAEVAELVVYLGGAFKTEADLDQGLAHFRERYTGQASPQALDEVLAWVRQQSLLARQDRDIGVVPLNYGLPDVGQLDEFVQLLQALTD